MSKPGDPPSHIDPAAQIAAFVDLFCAEVRPEQVEHLARCARGLGLEFTPDELCLLAALDTPARVQVFLNTQIYYNNDHAFPDQEETAMPPRRVLETALAHCFEGALFAYTVNYLHGHDPQLVLLEASQDSEHNLVVLRDPHTGLYGANAHSRYPHLDGRPAEYPTLRALAESYHPWYYSDRSDDPADLTLVGYSEPFDLVARYGVAWMSGDEPLWDIYYTYLDDTVAFHYLFDDSGETHLYPFVRALRDGWIRIDPQGQSFVSVDHLPPAAVPIWHAFWSAYDSNEQIPRGQAREHEEQFRQCTGTTPIDLTENADELSCITSSAATGSNSC